MIGSEYKSTAPPPFCCFRHKMSLNIWTLHSEHKGWHYSWVTSLGLRELLSSEWFVASSFFPHICRKIVAMETKFPPFCSLVCRHSKKYGHIVIQTNIKLLWIFIVNQTDPALKLRTHMHASTLHVRFFDHAHAGVYSRQASIAEARRKPRRLLKTSFYSNPAYI